jgi:diacylglycerol kinase family enzyme
MTGADAGQAFRWRQAAAVVALLALAAALVYVAVAASRSWQVVLLCLAALTVAMFALWFVVSRRGTSRVVAAVVAAVALVLFVVIVLVSVDLTVLLVAVALIVVSTVAARLALHVPTPRLTPAALPERPVLFLNPRSGGGKVESHDLVGRCRELGVEPVVLTPDSDLRELAEDAVGAGADLIGMAGGDGSQAVVADVARRHGIPFVDVPAGTRTDVALDLGLDRDDLVGSLEAFTAGVDRSVDLAEVNGRVFVNNASMGAYAKVVQSEEYREAKLRTALTVLPDVVGPDAEPIDLRYRRPSGEVATQAHLLLVSNNPYRFSPLAGPGTRERIDTGRLGIVSLLVGSAGGDASGVEEWAVPELVVESADPVEVGVDGEALRLDPPLRFVILPAALVVRLPAAAIERSRRRAAPVSAVAELWQIATRSRGAGAQAAR